MKSSTFVGVVVLVAVLLVSAPLHAADFGVRVGQFDDIDETFVGIEMAFDVGRFVFNPNFEYILIDDFDVMSLNADFLYPFARRASVNPYLGLGVGLMRMEVPGFGSETDTIVNAIAGVQFGRGRVNPYVQLKHFRFVEETSAYDTALTLGLRF
jgi:hypothetical protein